MCLSFIKGACTCVFLSQKVHVHLVVVFSQFYLILSCFSAVFYCFEGLGPIINKGYFLLCDLLGAFRFIWKKKKC
jgi:hypothetical protein